MYIYAIFYLLIGAALFVALFINYTDLLDTDESYVEIGCGEEYNLVCNYSDDLWDWTINYTPINEPEVWNNTKD